MMPEKLLSGMRLEEKVVLLPEDAVPEVSCHILIGFKT